ncbi:MAG: regulatory protein ArsR [Pseudonocardia sp.]|nr:regulatory protein ArsR [Pseudonocardia sp.]
MLAERTGLPVLLDKDTNAAAVAQHWPGEPEADVAATAVVLVGTGIGVGLFLDGRLYRGPRTNAGEFGHTTLAFDGPRCGCGRRGCVEVLHNNAASTAEAARLLGIGLVDLVQVRSARSTRTRIAVRLDAYPYRNMMVSMARAATTSDVFNAIAEPQRREILVLLRAGERPVTELAQELGMTQPGASKHLRVLREVGLVRDRKAGKQRLYGIDARGLRPVHEWTGGFERFWNESFDRLDAYVRDLKQAKQEE